MFGDANSWSAFSGPQGVIWGCALVALGVTFVLYSIGVPVWLSVPVFIIAFIGCLLAARPLFEKVEPAFEFGNEE